MIIWCTGGPNIIKAESKTRGLNLYLTYIHDILVQQNRILWIFLYCIPILHCSVVVQNALVVSCSVQCSRGLNKSRNVKLLKIFSSNIFIIFMGKQATSIILTNVDFSSDFQCDKVCQQTKLSLQDFFWFIICWCAIYNIIII